MKNRFLYLGLLACMIISSCEKGFECIDETLPVYSLEEVYGCVNTKYQMEIDLSEQYTIIRDQNDFESQVSGSCKPDIDFVKFDLVVGKRGLTSGNVRIEYSLVQICDVATPQLVVTFFQNITTEAPNLTYHVLIDKLAAAGNVQVSIHEKFE